MKNIFRKYCCLFIFLSFLPSIVFAATPSQQIIMSDLVATPNANGINLTFKLNHHVDYQGVLLSNPSRFVVDFKNTVLNATLDQPGLHHTHLHPQYI